MPLPRSVQIWADRNSGLKEKMGDGYSVRLSNMGVQVPTILYQGDHIVVQGNPLHVTVTDFEPAPTPPVNIFASAMAGNTELRDLKIVTACLVKMMGGVVTMHDHELIDAMQGLKLTTYMQDDPKLLILTSEDK